MKKISFLLLLAVAVSASAQQAGKFNKIVKKVKGDLNKDGKEDLVTITQDEAGKEGTYKLDIYFAQPDGKMKLIVSSTKAIEPGKTAAIDGKELGDVTITNGVLSIYEQLLRGNYTHKFRYQNGNFELIGYTDILSDGQGQMTTIDFNLSTGTRIELVERYDTDKVISKQSKKVMIRPLPRLQDFEPYQNDQY